MAGPIAAAARPNRGQTARAEVTTQRHMAESEARTVRAVPGDSAFPGAIFEATDRIVTLNGRALKLDEELSMHLDRLQGSSPNGVEEYSVDVPDGQLGMLHAAIASLERRFDLLDSRASRLVRL